MEAFRARFGARLRQLRKAAGLTQEQLAHRAGMDYKYLGGVERGERNITIDNIERIVRALGVEPYEPFLFALKDTRPTERLDEEAILNLIRRADASIRPVLISLTQSILRWAQARKR
jgi:transcriptional regulator with XRE-family HTH domain